MKNSAFLHLSFKEAGIVASIIIALMSVMMIGLEWVPHLPLLAIISGLLWYGKIKGVAANAMQQAMANGVMSGIGALYLFFFIGLMVSALMLSGSIPTLMYYGFEFLSAQHFYLSAFVLTALVGIAIGSSLTTVATLGVAFIGMGGAFEANPAIIAGAVVSGAFFGDKMSPLSDTTSIAAAIVDVDLFDHIKNMMYTTIPAFIVSALAFWYLGNASSHADLSAIVTFKQQLQQSGLVHFYALLPFVVLLVLAMRKTNALYTIIASIGTALIITYFHSSPSLKSLGGVFYAGYQVAEGVDLGDVGRLISRGGIEKMFFSQTIVILALSLGGLLSALGVVPALLEGISGFLTNARRAVLAAAGTSLGVNVLIGEQYLSLLLSGNAFRPVFQTLNIPAKNLARTIEDAGTVINPLVPWSVCGVFISHMLGVSVVTYLPYAFFCYISLLITLAFGAKTK